MRQKIFGLVDSSVAKACSYIPDAPLSNTVMPDRVVLSDSYTRKAESIAAINQAESELSCSVVGFRWPDSACICDEYSKWNRHSYVE